MAVSIHPSALVDPGAQLGEGVSIGAYAVIEAGVVVGDGCSLGHHSVLHAGVSLGRRNKVHAHAVLGGEPQDLKYAGQPTQLVVGDDNSFREFTTVSRGTAEGGGMTRLGDHNLLMAYAHVAHDCRLGDKIVMSNVATLGGHVQIGDWVIMGGLSAAHQFTQIGAHCFIANNAAVTRDVPPYVMAVGQPAVPHSVNSEGLKRRGFSAQQIQNIRRAYRVLYRSGRKLQAALEELEALCATQAEIRPFVDFIKRSSRSIVR